MKVITQPSAFRKIRGPVFLGAGFFDGVHKGHQIVLGSTVARARETGGQSWVLTFDRPPLAVLAPSRAPQLLMTLDDRLRTFEELGLDGALVLPFTRQLAVQEPETFVRSLCGTPRAAMADGHAHLSSAAQLSEIRCGDNWRFGRRGAGTPELLARLGELYGFRVQVVPYGYYQGVEISSTRIRTAVTEGRLADAAAMLGRPYFLRDKVIHGRGVAQPVLKVATANILPNKLCVQPPNGVYAVRVETPTGTFSGVSDLGLRPTFADVPPEQPVLETHIIDFSGDLYDKIITVSFLARLRDEQKFESPAALAEQIARDIAAARALSK